MSLTLKRMVRNLHNNWIDPINKGITGTLGFTQHKKLFDSRVFVRIITQKISQTFFNQCFFSNTSFIVFWLHRTQSKTAVRKLKLQKTKLNFLWLVNLFYEMFWLLSLVLCFRSYTISEIFNAMLYNSKLFYDKISCRWIKIL